MESGMRKPMVFNMISDVSKSDMAAAKETEAAMTAHEWESVAQYLWALLDSIDTLPDMIKPPVEIMDSGYYEGVTRRHKLRFNVGVTDGYDLAFRPPHDSERA